MNDRIKLNQKQNTDLIKSMYISCGFVMLMFMLMFISCGYVNYEINVYIHLEQAKVEFLSCIKKKKKCTNSKPFAKNYKVIIKILL